MSNFSYVAVAEARLIKNIAVNTSPIFTLF